MASALAASSFAVSAAGFGAAPSAVDAPEAGAPGAADLSPGARPGSSEMILRIDARMSSIVGSEAFSGVVIAVAFPQRGWPQTTATLRLLPP
jgi:hypothetical protein